MSAEHVSRAMCAIREEMQSCMSIKDVESGKVDIERLRNTFAPRIALRIVSETFAEELKPRIWGGGTSD